MVMLVLSSTHSHRAGETYPINAQASCVEVCFHVTMGREPMAPRTDRMAHIPSGVAGPVATKHAAEGSVFVDLRNAGTLKMA